MIFRRPSTSSRAIQRVAGRRLAAGVIALLAAACGAPRPSTPESIEFTRLPPSGEGSSDVTYPIQGRVKGARQGQKIVLFARSGVWWVQPTTAQPFTAIQRDASWRNTTHPGTAYAALLVDADYHPPATLTTLPASTGAIHAVVTADGGVLAHAPAKKIDFSGYEWEVRQTPGSPAGTHNRYDPDNAWVDGNGQLHLRINKQPDGWTSAQVTLFRSLGYGLYRFVIRDVSQFDPPVALAISSWDGSAPHQEMDIEISRWGELSGKNAQYVVQPYYIPANVVRFLAPPGRLTYSFDWQPGRATFRTVRGGEHEPGAALVSSHVFTSGVPSPAGELLQLNLYVFGDLGIHLQHSVEVIVEKFQYLP